MLMQRGKQYRFVASASNGQTLPDGSRVFGPATSPATVITTDACLAQGQKCTSEASCAAACCAGASVVDAAGQRYCG